MTNKSLLEVLKDTAIDMEFNKVTIRELELACFDEVKPLNKRQIRKIRTDFNASQTAMAKLLNVGVTTIQKWERGDTTPNGAALKLLHIAKDKGIDTLFY